jgi:hypothetical protein
MNEPTFDVAAAHRYFAPHFFNSAWDCIERPNRTAEDDERMIGLAHASVCHWRERPDNTERGRSIGYWQLSRVYAITGRPEEALRYGELSLKHAAGEPPFYVAYAHESIARAAMIGRDDVKYRTHLDHARRIHEQVTDAAEREALQKDLADLGT